MGVSWPTVAVSLVGQLAVGLLIAWVTVRLALGRFREEKWWERKYDAYSEMLTALHRMRKSFGEEAALDLRDVKPSDEQKAEWDSDFRAGKSTIARHTDLGDFLLSPSACKAIRRFGEKVRIASESTQWSDYVEGNLGATDELIENLKQEAKRDLGVRMNRQGPRSARASDAT
jgi:hypothetical protein